MSVDDRRVLDAELVGRLHVSCNELRVRHVGLQRQVGPAVLGVTAGVGREDLGVDPADGLEQRGRVRDRRGRGEVEHHVVGRKVEARGVVGVQQEGAALREDVPEAVRQHADIGDARRVRAAVDHGVDVGGIGVSVEASRPDLETRVEPVDRADGAARGKRVDDLVHDAALKQLPGESRPHV